MISIVVPMYNSINSIGRCLRSISSQTYTDIEMIVIDDGSTDNGNEVVSELSAKDQRIKYIRQNNRGASSARNHGIEVSKGEYICFVDSDDNILPDYIESLYSCMEFSNSDISVCGYQEVFTDRTVAHVLPKSEVERLTGKIHEDMYLLRKFINSPCLKLYKLHTIKEYDIRFNVNMVTAEDQDFNYRYYRYCSSISYVNTPGYVYDRNNSGLSRMRTRTCYENDLMNLSRKKDFIDEMNIANGELILAESICYMARRYTILSDEKNNYRRSKERLVAIDILRKPEKLSKKKDNIIYGLINKKLYLLIIAYMLVRLHKK